jgi:VanZ family protein
MMAGIFALSSRQQVPAIGFDVQVVAVAGHLVAYGVLAAALLIALEQLEWSSRQAAIGAFIGAVAYGLSDEVHQYFVPGRSADPLDLAVDAIGAALFLWAFLQLRERSGVSVRRWVLAQARRRA